MISAQAPRGVCREEKPVSTPHQVRGRLFPDHALAPLVARFGPEWNSPDDNKTRFFNILGGVDDSGCTVLLHSAGPKAVWEQGPARSLAREAGRGTRHPAPGFA